MRILIFLSLVFSALVSTANDFANSPLSIDEMIEKMPIEKQVGQLFIFGFTGSHINHSLKRQLDTLYPGSVIVFGRNIKSLTQIMKLNNEAQKTSLKNTKIPLLIAVDQEGGKVIRIKTSPSLPSARTLALTDNESLVQDAGYVTGQLLSTLGFNMNLAPVVDISNASYTDFLGNRSFSHQKEIVNKMSTAFSKGLIDAGILPTAKHFPGHGGVQTDSHLATPYKQITLTELLFNDLAPYKEMQRNKIPFAIMASHISYPLIDTSKRPATFSSLLLKNVLRNGLGFDGIILTDDIQMDGAKIKNLSVGERAVQAVLAGNDIVMVGWSYRVQKLAVNAVIKAVKSGRISKKRLHSSLRRILQYKMQFYKKNQLSPLKKQLAQIPLKETYGKIFKQVLKKQAPSLSLIGDRVDVYSFSWRFLSSYKKTGKSHLRHLKSFKGWGRSKKADTIVYHLSGSSSEKLLRKAPNNVKSKIVVVNSSSHLRIGDESLYKKVINIHSYHPNLGLFTAQHLLSNKTPVRQPTSLENGI